jgi:hypothetical protein
MIHQLYSLMLLVVLHITLLILPGNKTDSIGIPNMEYEHYQAESVTEEVTGYIYEAANTTPLQYANIGVLGKNQGTVSDANGRFRLRITNVSPQDMVAISYVGYQTLYVSVTQLKEISSTGPVILEPADIQMETILVTSSQRRKTQRFGSRGVNPIAFGIVQSADLTDIAECAQRMHFPEHGARAQSFNIYLREVHTDTVTFRLNFYKYDGEPLPERAFNSELLFRRHVDRGWLRLDLSEFDIWLRGDILATIEFLPEPDQLDSVSFYYGGVVRRKNGGISYKRTSSHGIWEKNTIGTYAMYIVADFAR